ncbi:MAG TPA: hypothetical protein VF916_07660, partial [Ktedonobacterales bacterium]
MRLIEEALRLVDPLLRLLLVQGLAVEGGRVQRRLDLERQRIALVGQALDRGLDRGVDAVV